ncbi:MAG: DNA mismatch repair endonuclease MutL [Bacteroidales bacterium]|nr:DNA mismatch repair endonuclease MutL [Candidatus Liminaster caballi]
MDLIHLLPDSVANQIAAGEVVQRPASVIKELLENSVDAKATDIQVFIREAGRELIQVIDNGMGMSHTDARMAFERHATSKIKQAADLFSLHTMGFRGEALPSIVAVSELEMRTRRAEDETGVHLSFSGSVLQRQEAVVCQKGTNIEVRNLFFNVPARRKFLKSNQTELSNIITELQHVALANPQVAFSITHNDTLLFKLDAGSLKQRIVQVFSKQVGQQLIPVNVENDLISINGFVCQPESARKKGALQYFFVNDRYMRHPYFHKAVMECYKDLIADGEQPNYFIYMKVDPASIDVNIHPTKTEIKFENEAARWHILMATIREAMGKYNAVPAIDFDQADAPDIAAFDPSAPMPHEPKVSFNNDYNPFKKSPVMSNWTSLYEDFSNSRDGSVGHLPESQNAMPSVHVETIPSRMDMGNGTAGNDDTEPLPSRMSTILDDVPDYVPPTTQLVDPLHQAPSVEPHKSVYRKYLQVSSRYIVASTRQGMVLIDQHRAHMTVLFDRYYQQIRQRQGISQQELFPEVIEVSKADVPVMESILDDLRYLGFELDSLGGGSYALNGKPASLDKSIDFNVLLQQMLDEARDEVHGVGDELGRKLALRLSATQALPYGKTLSEEEMSQLIDSLYALPDHTYAPDGHLIAVHLSVDELDARF